MPNGSKNGSTARRRMVDSVWMLTTAGRTLCATTTIGVRRAALTRDGIGASSWRGWRASVVCDSASGLQATEIVKRTTRMRTCFMAGFYGLTVGGWQLAESWGWRTANRQLSTANSNRRTLATHAQTSLGAAGHPAALRFVSEVCRRATNLSRPSGAARPDCHAVQRKGGRREHLRRRPPDGQVHQLAAPVGPPRGEAAAR